MDLEMDGGEHAIQIEEEKEGIFKDTIKVTF